MAQSNLITTGISLLVVSSYANDGEFFQWKHFAYLQVVVLIDRSCVDKTDAM